MNPTTRTEIPNEYESFRDRVLLDRAVPLFLHTRFSQVRDIPGGFGTDTIKFRKFGALAVQTTPLTPGVTPVGKQLSVTDVTAQVQYYGDYVTLIDEVLIESYDPVLTEAADILGEQVGLSVDTIARDLWHAGTNVQYASTATQRSEITTAMVLNNTEVQEAVLTLKLNEARPVTSMVNPSTQYNTTPLKASFIGILHPRTTKNCEADGNWTPVEKYSQQGDKMEGEVGAFPYVRFLETTNAKVFAGEGLGGVDVYSTLIFGQNATAVTRISSMVLQNIVMPLGSGGTTDPLKQRATSGWKLSFVGKILQQIWIIRIEHGVN